MSNYTGRPDLTGKQSAVSPGASDTRLLYLCGTARHPHRGFRAGGQFRRGIAMICPGCTAKGRQG